MEDSLNVHRLFFALWPSDSVRQSIGETFSQLMASKSIVESEPAVIRGHALHPQNLHITLHFIGQTTTQTRECMHRAAQSLTQPPAQDIITTNRTTAFDLILDCFGHFPKAKIFWMGAQDIPVELIRLQRQLGDALKSCGYRGESRKYQPHVTLMRKCSGSQLWNRGAQAGFSIPWQVDDFVLVESIPNTNSQGGGVSYHVIEKYPLP